MIFSNQLYGKVLRGEKTQTRRLVSSSDQPVDMHGDKIPVDKYFPGKRIAVQKGRGIHGEGHIILTAVRKEWLGQLDFDAARAEGFRDTIAFKTYWLGLHDKAWVKANGEEIEPGIYALEDEQIVDRFEQRWGGKLVWVLTFALDTSEQPIMLMQGSPLTDGGKARVMSNRKLPPGRAKSSTLSESSPETHGYTASGPRAMPREAEPVDAATQKRYAMEKTQGFIAREAQRQADRERLGLVEHLALVLSEGRDGRVEESIRKRIRALESKNRRRT